jgi:7,8-dihydropterin-6-yl-methyl-4-(beta-D-ribofuranosyl)aminobenzene 5'-phosphate synthase
MDTLLTVLCDNCVGKSGFVGEHGFSLLIEQGKEKYLFDTGPGMSLPLNLKAAGKDLDGLIKVIISHGHYDHTGGLKWVAEDAAGVEVVAHPALFSEHMIMDSESEGRAPRYIGCPFSRDELEASGARFRFLDHTDQLSPGLWFISGIERIPAMLPSDGRLVRPEGGKLAPDTVEDDASLLLETHGAPILIMGCAHSGVLNILRHLREKMRITRLRGILGGTHLMFYGPEHVSKTIEELERFSVQLIAVCHCTGMGAMVELSKHFGNRFTPASAGGVFTL